MRQPLAPLTWRVPPTWTWRSPGCSSRRARGACGPAAHAGSGCTWGSGGDTREKRTRDQVGALACPGKAPQASEDCAPVRVRHLCPAFSLAFPGHDDPKWGFLQVRIVLVPKLTLCPTASPETWGRSGKSPAFAPHSQAWPRSASRAYRNPGSACNGPGSAGCTGGFEQTPGRC